MRSLFVTSLVALLAVLVPLPGASAASAAGLERGVHRLTNSERADEGVEELRKQRCVDRFAGRQAKRMAAQDRMFHQDLGPIMEKCGLAGAGENVAAGYSSASSVVSAWMGSPGHKANILRPSFRLLGVGARRSDSGTWYYAQVFGHK